MLSDLYHGKINPSERDIPPMVTDHNQKWVELSEMFEQSLNPAQVDIYHELCDMQSESAAHDNEALYIQGFRDGVQMMLDVLL